MRFIDLTQGVQTIVDDEDFEKINAFKWYYNKVNNAAHRSFMENGKKTGISLHRFIMDAPSGLQVDHINGDRLDNRRENLRLCTQAENLRNVKKNKGNSSAFKGVHLHKTNRHKTSKFVAKIQIDKKTIKLGYFYTEKEAAIAYNKAAIEYHREFANLNEVEDKMNFTEYQITSARTLPENKHFKTNVSNFAMGIAGESGEVVDYLKKVIFHGHEMDKNHLEKELGDILWYVSALATINNINLEDVAVNNIEKLKKRYPEGFNEQKSINREE